MSNALMMRYAATRGNDDRYNSSMSMRGDYDRRNTYAGDYDRRENRQPNQYTRRNGMDDDWPEDNSMAMRRRRDKRGRFMEDDDEPMEMNAYSARRDYRRSEYDEPEDRYIPPVMPVDRLYDGGGIGFGRDDQERPRSHYDEHKPVQQGGRQMVKAGGTFWMKPNEGTKSHGQKTLSREKAQEWVDAMVYYDDSGKEHHGGKWAMSDVKPFAQKMGIPTDGEKFFEFYAMMNAMYADYMAVARKYGVTSPEFYAGMAKAWMDDPDAVDGKTMMYYDCIVKKPD